jgi:arylsulfatase A
VRSALVALLLLAVPAIAVAQISPPNIVLVVADDLGWAELGCYGQKHIKTPALDKLAADGMKFTQFYSGQAVCAPSRCVLMTGKHTGHAAVRDNREAPDKAEGQLPMPADEVTVVSKLKKLGYVTAGMGKWGLGMFGTSGDPLKHGFDTFYGYNCQRHAHTHYPTYLYRNAERFDLKGNDGAKGDSFSHDLFEKEALGFLDTTPKNKPFFLYLPFTVPHVAVQAPADAVKEYEGKLGDDPAYDGKKGYRVHPAPHAGYAAMVSRLDRTVGRIVDKLNALKLEKNTLVLFTSDNGPTHNVGGADSTFFKSAGDLKGLKGSLYEGGIRVPLLAYWPGKIKAGSTCDTPFAFWDVMPTLCAAASIETPKGIDGISFYPTLLGNEGQKKHDFLYWEFPGYGGQQAVREVDWKAVRQKLGQKKIVTELYDLKADPNETTDVAAKHPDVLKKLEARMVEQHTPSKDFPLQAIDTK